jgi:tRNA-splicing ligase RtcB
LRKLDQRAMNDLYLRDGIVVNLDGEVPLDESGPCYKDANEVVAAVVAAGLARIEHTLSPLASLKGNEKASSRNRRRDKESRERSRDKERAEARRRKG